MYLALTCMACRAAVPWGGGRGSRVPRLILLRVVQRRPVEDLDVPDLPIDDVEDELSLGGDE
jgi:hypothetical protein